MSENGHICHYCICADCVYSFKGDSQFLNHIIFLVSSTTTMSGLRDDKILEGGSDPPLVAWCPERSLNTVNLDFSTEFTMYLRILSCPQVHLPCLLYICTV